MFKLKPDKKTVIFSTVFMILSVACFVSCITLCIRGPRPIFVKEDTPKDTVSSSACLTSTPDYGEYYVNDVIYLADTAFSGIKDAEVLRYGSETLQLWSGSDGDVSLDAKIASAQIIFPENGKEIYIKDALEAKKPDYLIISLGISNGVPFCTEEKFKSYYSDLIAAVKEISPDTKIILQSVLPVSKKYERKTQGVSMEKINRANGWIVDIAEENQVKYLHTVSCLKNKDGYLDQKYDSGDGLHLNKDGYIAVLNYIRTHGYK